MNNNGEFICCRCGGTSFTFHFIDKVYFNLQCTECKTCYSQCMDDYNEKGFITYCPFDDDSNNDNDW